VVAQGGAAGRAAVLRDRRDHRFGRLLECSDPRRAGELAQRRGQGAWGRRLHRRATTAGDFHRIILGITTMSLFVVAINRVFWRPLYYFAERKYRLS